MSKSLIRVLFYSFSTHFTYDTAQVTHDITHLLMTLFTLLIRTHFQSILRRRVCSHLRLECDHRVSTTYIFRTLTSCIFSVTSDLTHWPNIDLWPHAYSAWPLRIVTSHPLRDVTSEVTLIWPLILWKKILFWNFGVSRTKSPLGKILKYKGRVTPQSDLLKLSYIPVRLNELNMLNTTTHHRPYLRVTLNILNTTTHYLNKPLLSYIFVKTCWEIVENRQQ